VGLILLTQVKLLFQNIWFYLFRSAKEKKMRIWKDFVASAQPTLSIKDKDFSGKVCFV